MKALTEALVARGVDVTLFATADSITAGVLAGVCPRPYSEDPTIEAKVWELPHVSHVFERAGEFDLIFKRYGGLCSKGDRSPARDGEQVPHGGRDLDPVAAVA